MANPLPEKTPQTRLRAFVWPRMNRRYGARVAAVAAAAFLLFRFVLQPARVDGVSMQPAYSGHGFNFCNRLAYRRRPPRRGEVAILRYGGRRWMIIKRVLAFAGETVEFRDGRCLVDGRPLDEPYVVFPCDWNAPPRTVPPDHLYVMGDNRSMPMETHVGGVIPASRIHGKPLW